MVLPIGAKERNQTKFDEKHLTTSRLYGLMRPVARIAQSVEQGIENPRVLGSIPSPGTNIHKASLKSGAFSFLSYGRFLVVATRYFLAGFFTIFADVRYI